MLNYIVRRVLLLIPVLCIIAVVTFFITHVLPGDPVRLMLGDFATKDQIQELERKLGYDRPVYVQFLFWLKNVLQGDFGDSLFLRMPVTKAILSRVEPTFLLAITGITVGTLIGIPLGVLAAIRHKTWIDQFAIASSLIGITIPNFFLALMLILVFGVQLRLLPVAGYRPVSEVGIGVLRYLILPGMSIGFMQSGSIARMTRSAMLDVLRQDYVRTARAKGLTEKLVIARHALKNSLIPVVTVLGFNLAMLLGGTWIAETVFTIPGTGALAITSIMRRDFPVIQGSMIFVTVVYMLVNLIVDISYAYLNPRIKYH
ncbi:MAG: ABC transporter permease [Spirochaetaceae bacterium]|nr:MAG: ABC transporter permease [Spirochaetaceae bacterium]